MLFLGNLRFLIDSVNDGLVKRLRGSTDTLFDVAGLAETVGLVNRHSPNEGVCSPPRRHFS